VREPAGPRRRRDGFGDFRRNESHPSYGGGTPLVFTVADGDTKKEMVDRVGFEPDTTSLKRRVLYQLS
jgi:hypothetical protein